MSNYENMSKEELIEKIRILEERCNYLIEVNNVLNKTYFQHIWEIICSKDIMQNVIDVPTEAGLPILPEAEKKTKDN